MKNWMLAMGTFRLRFLLLTPACVLLGVATAFHETGFVDSMLATLVLVAAVAAHMSVNAFNEVQDFHSGLDQSTQRTPFSGGSGTLPGNPDLAVAAHVLAWLSLAVMLAIGVWLFLLRGAALLPLGTLGVFLILAYTRWVTRHAVICLIAPGTGFGLLMVVGTHVTLTGTYSPISWAAGLPVFFLVNNLLLLNQFPDVEADREVGRAHLLVRNGPEAGRVVYAVMLVAAYLSLLAGVTLDVLPIGALLGMLTAPLGLFVARGVWRRFNDIEALLPCMGMNVLINLATPVLMAVGVLLLGKP